MAKYRIKSPDGGTFEITAPDGASQDQVLAYARANMGSPKMPGAREQAEQSMASRKLAAEDAARKKANEEAPWYEQLGTGIKTQAGRTMLGMTEFADNLSGNRLLDQRGREILAEAQREADRRDAGTGAAGFVGNMVGDFRNLIPVGGSVNAANKARTVMEAAKQTAKVGGLSGALTGLTESTGDADSTIFTNLGNAAIGGAAGAGLGGALPVAGAGIRKGTDLTQGGLARTLAFMGSDRAAESVAYKNVANVLREQGYAPGEVANILADFQAQGIDGGTLGQMLESGALMAREKNLLQGGGRAGRTMAEKLKEQPRKISESVIAKARATAQPDETNYLYTQAAELADTPTPTPFEKGWFHGTADDVRQFDLDRAGTRSGTKGERAVWFTRNPDEAAGFAQLARDHRWDRLRWEGKTNKSPEFWESGPNVMPHSVDPGRQMTVDFKGKKFDPDAQARAIEEAQKGGLASVLFKNVWDNGQTGDQLALLDPSRAIPAMARHPAGPSATAKDVPFTLAAIEEDIAERAGELPTAVLNRIKRIISTAKQRGGFEAADTAKQQLDDLFKENSQTTDQDIVNEVVSGYRKMLNDSLEWAGGEVYETAKNSAKRDMAMRDVETAFKHAQGSSVKTALNDFFGSLEKQQEFLRKLPEGLRREFESYLANLEKVSGKFGGSDTNLNGVTTKQMNAETGLGFDTNLNPLTALDRVTAPLQRRVRQAQAELTFAPDPERIAATMRKGEAKPTVPAKTARVLATETAKGMTKGMTETEQPEPIPTVPARKPQSQPKPETKAAPPLMDRIAQAESSGNPDAKSKTSSASGLMQFTDGTWKLAVARWGKETGVTLADKHKPEAQKKLAEKLTADNARILAKQTGRQPSDADLYAAHVLGAGDAAKLIKAKDSPRQAILMFPRKKVNANRPIFYDGKRPRTAAEVYALLEDKVT
ncbi:MAG: transglycosylase SLT domain-containing protein [Gemmataceae bacterium]|nr:transglycosylase SLT domain-containing protein [Gemmataceae bacterium]